MIWRRRRSSQICCRTSLGISEITARLEVMRLPLPSMLPPLLPRPCFCSRRRCKPRCRCQPRLARRHTSRRHRARHRCQPRWAPRRPSYRHRARRRRQPGRASYRHRARCRRQPRSARRHTSNRHRVRRSRQPRLAPRRASYRHRGRGRRQPRLARRCSSNQQWAQRSQHLSRALQEVVRRCLPLEFKSRSYAWPQRSSRRTTTPGVSHEGVSWFWERAPKGKSFWRCGAAAGSSTQ